MTNKDFAETDEKFKHACSNVGLPRRIFNVKRGGKTVSVNHAALGLKRQAGKWLRHTGLAYQNKEK